MLRIQEIARINGIKANVELLIRKKRLKILLQEHSPPAHTSSRIKWMRLPFLGKFSYKLAAELSKYNYRVGFYPLLNLGRLSALKDRTTLLDRSGIYRASCGDCDAVYVGQTGRKLSKRINEHKSKNDSAVYKHCSLMGHDPDHANFELLHTCGKGRTMNALEEIETAKILDRNSLNDTTHTLMNHFIRYYYDTPYFSS